MLILPFFTLFRESKRKKNLHSSKMNQTVLCCNADGFFIALRGRGQSGNIASQLAGVSLVSAASSQNAWSSFLLSLSFNVPRPHRLTIFIHTKIHDLILVLKLIQHALISFLPLKSVLVFILDCTVSVLCWFFSFASFNYIRCRIWWSSKWPLSENDTEQWNKTNKIATMLLHFKMSYKAVRVLQEAYSHCLKCAHSSGRSQNIMHHNDG